MQVLVGYALPGIVLVSALGALILCMLVLRYGPSRNSEPWEDEEEPRDRAQQAFVIRLGHAAAALCFAFAAILAVFLIRASMTPATPVVQPASSEELAQLREQLGRTQAWLADELQSIGERLEAAEVTRELAGRREGEGGPALPAPPRVAPAPPASPARVEPREPARRPTPAPQPVRRAPDSPSALASPSTNRVTAMIQGVRVELDTHADRSLTARLFLDADNRPLTGAYVLVEGRTTDGIPVRVALEPAGVGGVYRGRPDTIATLQDLRLRVVARDRRFEVSLSPPVTW